MQLDEMLAEVNRLKVEIDKLRPLKPEVEQRIMHKFRLDWNYHSNAIEGNSLTPGETRAFLLEGLTANGKPLKDHLDLRGHNELLGFLVLFIQRREELTEAAIREMHKILLREPYETEAVTLEGHSVKKLVRLGEYKHTPNFVRTASGDIYPYASPEDVTPRMGELVAWHRTESTRGDLHPMSHAAIFHHRFLRIHPFDDGNGRLGRVLMNLILMRHGFPPVIIKLAAREPYVAALRRADAGETDAIVAFIGECLLDSERLYLRGAHGESIEDSDDIEKAVALLKQELRDSQKPLELTQEVQTSVLKDKLVPLLDRIDKKVSQFDDLFARSELEIRLTWDVIPPKTMCVSRSSGRTALLGFKELTFSGNLSERPTPSGKAQRRPVVLRELHLGFRWEGFQKDGPNDFSVNAELSICFNSRNYRFRCELAKLDNPLVYQDWLTEDQQKQVISAIAKGIYEQIQQRRSKNRQG